jgi:hypothetical protein
LQTAFVNLLLGEITMKLFTSILIVVLFSGVLSAQNISTNLPVTGNTLLNDSSITLGTLNQTTEFEKQIAESAGTESEGSKSLQYESFSSISKRAEVNQQYKINDLKEKMTDSKKKQKISYCDSGSCDTGTSSTGFWVFISAVAFAVSTFIGKGK